MQRRAIVQRSICAVVQGIMDISHMHLLVLLRQVNGTQHHPNRLQYATVHAIRRRHAFPSVLSGRQIPHDGRKASSLMALRVDDVFLTSLEQALLFVAEVDALQQSTFLLEQFLMLFLEAPSAHQRLSTSNADRMGCIATHDDHVQHMLVLQESSRF